MISSLYKYWPIISTSLLLTLLASIFLMPNLVGIVAITILVLGLGFSITFTIHRNYTAFISAEITREKMNRTIAIDLLALVLIILLAGIASRSVTTYTGIFAESRWHGLGFLVGFIAAILVSFAVGFGMRWVTRKITKPHQARKLE